jgi:DNA (cytosine-5)-methyltransferase 1
VDYKSIGFKTREGKRMRKLSLFSGIGGIDLAAHWAGMQTVSFCEKEPFPQKVLQKNFPGVPIYDDVCTLTKERLEHDGIIGEGRTIDIISAGYPCQPFSIAGRRKGEEDDRHLWPEVKRILEEIRPSWFVGENVAGHINMGLDQVLDDLESIDYTTEPIVLPACSVGAFHRRDRVFVLAHSNSIMRKTFKIQSVNSQKGLPQKPKQWEQFQFKRSGNNDFEFREEDESMLCRDDDGVPRELDEHRFKGVGNAVNPYQVYPILTFIKEINDSLTT